MNRTKSKKREAMDHDPPLRIGENYCLSGNDIAVPV